MSKIFSIKSNLIFLALVLVTGTITLSAPSFTSLANAQTESYYYGERENGYDSYEAEPREYPPQYTERDYNNYLSEYDMGSNEKKSYRNDYYEQPREYTSYQQDYKEDYPKYVKDNNSYKSKKDISNSVNINKLNCINNNVNINGNNTDDINIGNSGSSGTGEGYLGVGSYGSSGFGGEGYSNQNKGFDCIINNNNTNNNFGAGNATDRGGNPTEPDATLAVTKTVTCTPNDTTPLADAACEFIRSNVLPSSFNITVTGDNPNPSQFAGSNESAVVVNLGAGIYEVTEEAPFVVPPFGGVFISINTSFAGDCTDVNPNDPMSTEARGTIEAGESQTCDIRNDFRPFSLPQPVGLTASNINTINQASSFSSSPTISQGMDDSPELTALEKTTKLKQQWLGLLP